MACFIDTHAHLDEKDFDTDRQDVISRATEAGCKAVFLPAIDLQSSRRILALCQQYPAFFHAMLGLHPEEVRADWPSHLADIRTLLESELASTASSVIAIGEVGLDYYWSREFEHEQLKAFEQQVLWSIETRLPLMIHCRKAQNEMVHLLRQYERQLPGGVFHCFTGNEKEAAELLQFERFVLGIGGVFTFRKSHLPEVLPATVPLDRIVLETDAPYMAPVPHRGQRNESAFVAHVLAAIARAYDVSEETVASTTTATVQRIFGIDIDGLSCPSQGL
ncbi:MAG: TatD family hydrolase [Prevotella sp.]|nr:TatD family hydrolase [Prevotella sp.]